jgi:hypothetical protein
MIVTRGRRSTPPGDTGRQVKKKLQESDTWRRRNLVIWRYANRAPGVRKNRETTSFPKFIINNNRSEQQIVIHSEEQDKIHQFPSICLLLPSLSLFFPLSSYFVFAVDQSAIKLILLITFTISICC